MTRVPTYLLLAGCLFFIGVLSAAQDVLPTPETIEQPPWEVCNETSFVLDIAIAGTAKDQAGAPMTVRGWQNLRPGLCRIVDVEKGTPRFVYARSANLHQGGVREWKGRHEYCVSGEDFTAKTDISCALQDMVAAKFLQVVPTERHTAFTEPEDFGRRAETAGLQRLLGDNNYDIKRIDGRPGKRTRNTLNKFLKDQGLKTNITVAAQYAALQKAAVEARKTVGIKVCNKSSARIWVALAYNSGAGKEARGWWPVAMGRCVQPFAENLKNRDAHYYVRQENAGAADKILQVAADKGGLYCVGASTFASLQHEFCRDRGYIPVRFKPVPADKPGVVINLQDGDFNIAPVSGLRP
ncbi:MAG: hypothetical protein COA91_02395 [Robiginitomaculum sp.]|nr:MAG: hypothetical protein COA91_02395 [Robiginitomaculum sp.]